MVSQNPAPGTFFISFCVGIQTFILSLSSPQERQAWLRSNIGHVGITFNEIIREVDHNKTPLGWDWFDIPMWRVDEENSQVRMPLCYAEHFEGKCFFEKMRVGPALDQRTQLRGQCRTGR